MQTSSGQAGILSVNACECWKRNQRSNFREILRTRRTINQRLTEAFSNGITLEKSFSTATPAYVNYRETQGRWDAEGRKGTHHLSTRKSFPPLHPLMQRHHACHSLLGVGRAGFQLVDEKHQRRAGATNTQGAWLVHI